MTTKKIGLLGSGIVATYSHVPAIFASELCDFAGIFDPNPDQLRKIQEKHHISPDLCYTDVKKFFRECPMDAVSIASAAPAHKENCLLAVKYGKPMLCEKPLALNEEDGRIMVDTAAKARVPLWMGLVVRFAPVAQKIYELIRRRAIGDIRSLRLIFNWSCHGQYKIDDDTGKYGINRRREGRMFEGGPLIDTGTHQIDLARWWLNSEVVRYDGFGAWVENDYESPDHTWLHLDHENGAHTMIEVSFAYGHTTKETISEFIYELIGTEGVIRYDRNQKTIVIHGKKEDLRLPSDEDRGFHAMYDEFARALDTGKSDILATGMDGLIATRISRLSTDEAINKHMLLNHQGAELKV
ncbi:oxidoreductase [Planctomycetales bacterium]|nr:oxidoreductase [Planctomycetales bacterium]GHV19182.1 oxidoreductase [Planctomycetales bacterium]